MMKHLNTHAPTHTLKKCTLLKDGAVYHFTDVVTHFTRERVHVFVALVLLVLDTYESCDHADEDEDDHGSDDLYLWKVLGSGDDFN